MHLSTSRLSRSCTQEQLHLLSFDAVKADKEQLEREIRGLKKEVDDWKVIVQSYVLNIVDQ